mgnify:CR=1 FL=1
MPVFLLTIHAYRSWNADRPQGYVRRGQGVLPRDNEVARAYDRNAVESPAVFDVVHQRAIAQLVAEACERRDWRLHAIACEPTHFHALVSWKDELQSTAVCAKLKNLVSRQLNLGLPTKRRWLSRGASRKQVKDRAHFDQLVFEYLPKHSGLVWTEGMPPIGPPPPGGG